MADGPTRPLLELVPAGPVRSDVFDFKGESAKWRLLDGLEIMACRTAAQKQVLAVMVNELGLEAKDAFPLIQAGSAADTEREWFEYYVIAAAMTDAEGAPIAQGSPDDIAREMADKCTPIERAKYIDDYLSFADEHDPSEYSDDEYGEMIAALGKGDTSIVQQRGSSSLRSLLLFMAPRLAKAEGALAQLEAAQTIESRVEALEAAISQTHRSEDGSD